MKGARLIAGLTFSLALTGLLLCYTSLLGTWRLAVGVVILHLLAACLLLILVVPFLWIHIRGRGRLHFNNAAMLALLGGMFLSGVALTVVGRRGHLPALHWVSSLAFLVAMLQHARFGQLTAVLNDRSLILKLAGVAVILAGVAFVALTLESEGVLAREQIPFTSMAIVGGLPAYDRSSMAAENCAACHSKEVEEWKQSLHAVSDTEIIYARVVGEFRERHGIEASNWCAACHSPLRLARGELNIKVADVEQPNVGCIVCHSIQEIHEPVGSNSYDLAVRTEKRSTIGIKLGISNRMLLLQPGAHRGRWNVGLPQRPEFCGACHQQILPESLTNSKNNLTLQDTFGEWLESRFNSPNPAERKTCQDCHMPTTHNLHSILGLRGRSHVFAGASADIAQLSGARTRLNEVKELLANTASLSLEVTDCKAGSLGLLVKVTNYGAGHNLPTGATDLREVWLRVIVTDGVGKVLYESGQVNEDGVLDPAATRFGVTLGDEAKRPLDLHDIIKARYVLRDTTIKAGETRSAVYQFPVHVGRGLKVEVHLLYRAVPQAFLNHFMTSDLRFQIIEMSNAFLKLDTLARCESSDESR